MSEPWDSMARDAGYDPKTPEGRALAWRIEDEECRRVQLAAEEEIAKAWERYMDENAADRALHGEEHQSVTGDGNGRNGSTPGPFEG